MTVSAGYADQVLAVTSSHFGSAEKQFRFHSDTGIKDLFLRPGPSPEAELFCSQHRKAMPKYHRNHDRESSDYGVRDSLNMGVCMAPAAADTICQNLMDFNRQPQDYDRIITGDLGYVGQTILLEPC